MNFQFFDAAKLQETAKSQLGKPYKWGAKPNGPNPDCFDCSGFVRWVLLQQGIVVSEGSYEQYMVTKPVSNTLQIGDVGFFMNPDGSTKHVGLILDEKTVIEACSNAHEVKYANNLTYCVMTRPRSLWEGQGGFSGWRRFAILY